MSKRQGQPMVDEILDKDAVEPMVGRSGSPVHHLPRNKRLQLRKWLGVTESIEQILSPESHLRALLASGMPIRKELLDHLVISKALNTSDILRYGPMLSVATTTIDSSVLFQALEKSIRELSPSLSLPSVRNVRRGLQRWTRWIASGEGVLSPESAIGLIRVLNLVLTRVTKPKGRAKKLHEATKSFVRTILSLAGHPTNPPLNSELCLASLRLLKNARDIVGEDTFEDLLTTDDTKTWFDSIRADLPVVLDGLAFAGCLDDLSELAALSKHLPAVESIVRLSAENLWRTKAALLPGNVQKWLQNYLGIAQQVRLGKIEFVSPSERPEIAQLGLALLRAWDARQDSQAAKQAFEVIQDVCRKFFNLRLGGDVGARVRFDPRFHEVDEETKGQGELVIRRPWVEWREGETWRVIIRAVVGSA